MKCGAPVGIQDGVPYWCTLERPCPDHDGSPDKGSGDPAREAVPYGTLVEGTPRNLRADLLLEAERLVNGDRNVQYGDPKADFQRTAAFWSAYLGVEVTPHDVGAMMGLLKISRIRWSPEKYDHWLDLAGYAACGWHCAAPDEA